jgi:hypothetical protein
MSLFTSLTTVRYYTPADPYYYSVDNRPIEDLNDNVETVANYVDDLANSDGSSRIGYIHSFTGAVSRTVQSRLRDFYSVADAGAVGDGVTVNNTAVANLDAVTTWKYMPSGIYKITSALSTLEGPFIGPGRIKDNSGNLRGAYFSIVKAAPSSSGVITSVETAFNGDINKVLFPVEHRITGTNTLGNPTTGYNYIPESSPFYTYFYNASGWNNSTSNTTGRTMAAGFFTKVEQAGQGDAYAISTIGTVSSTRASSTNFLANPAVGLARAELSAAIDGAYLNALILDHSDGGFDAAAAGVIVRMSRSNVTAAKSAYWTGIRVQSYGGQNINQGYSIVGPVTVGIDFTSATINQSAIALKADQKIHFNTTSSDGRFADSFGGEYIAYSSGGSQMEFYTNSILRVAIKNSDGSVNIVNDFSVNTNKFNVVASSGNTSIAGTLASVGDFAVNTNKFNVTASSGNTSVAGTFSVTGDLAVNTNKFNVTAASGNTAVAGTLVVTGAGTFSSTLGVTGNFAVNTNKFNVTAASGNTTVGGTFGVTGATTLSSTLTIHGVTSTGATGSGDLVFRSSPALISPALGTPTSGNLANCTGFPIGSVTGLGASVAAFLASATSANLAAAITDETGSGPLVFAASPNLSGTPTINSNTIWHSGNDGSGSGLDADTLDGTNRDTAYNGFAANSIPIRNPNGYLYTAYFNMTADQTTSTATRIVVEQSTDGFLRWQTPAQFIANHGIWTSGNDGAGSGLDADMLDGISSGSFARVDAASNFTTAPTISGNTVWHAGNDGAGSGLDADTLDGLSSGSFLRLDATTTRSTGFVTQFDNTASATFNADSGVRNLAIVQPTAGSDAFITFLVSSDFGGYFGMGGAENDLVCGGWSYGNVRYRIWHSGNDGAGSGLDADLLDGISSGSFARVDAATNFTTAPTINSATIWTSSNDGSGSGLDADLLDGLNSATAATVSTIVARDGSGHINAVYFNQSSSVEVPTIGSFFVENSGADGYLRKISLANAKTQLGIPTVPTLADGTYTPTVTAILNTGGITALACQYLRVGDTVTVSGQVNFQVVTANSQSIIDISLPIASALSAQEQLAGVAERQYLTTENPLSSPVYGNITNDRARLEFLSDTDTGVTHFWHFTFTYRVV